MVYIDTLMAASDPLVRTPYLFLARQPFRESRLRAYIRRDHRRGRHLDESLADPRVEAAGGKGLAWNRLLQAETIVGLDEQDVVGAIVDCRPTRRPSARGRDAS